MKQFKIAFFGDELQKDHFPMRGIPQTLLREWARQKHYEVEFVYINSNQVLKCAHIIKQCNAIVFIISDGFDKELYRRLQTHDFGDKIIKIGFSIELLDTWNRKSTYDYFNFYHQYAYRKALEYEIFPQLDLIISPSPCTVPNWDVPIAYYPYLFAPSVYEDKITFMRNLISKKPRLDIDNLKAKNENVTMVYKSTSIFREKMSDCLNSKIPINFGGKFRNNDNRVKGGYEFDIVNEYFSLFKFNLAIENEFAAGYWTEKLINPLLVDTIPIYYDPFNTFPESIINKNACVVTNDDNFRDKMDEVAKLCKDSTAYLLKYQNLRLFADQAPKQFEDIVFDAVYMIDQTFKMRDYGK